MSTTVPRVPTAAPSPEVARAVEFMRRLFPEPRAFDIRLWEGTVMPGSSETELTVVINRPGSLRRMLRPPVELSLGEAYLRGDFDLEGEVWAAGPALEASRGAARSLREMGALFRLWRALPTDDLPRAGERVGDVRGGDPSASGGYGSAPARIRAAEQSREWDREGIRYHYDAGNDFYALFLDRRMVYSCAYFATGSEDLDTAQEQKLDLICRKLRLRDGERFLDVGCGWGALVLHAAQHYGVRALGVTLSEQQYRLASQRIADAGLSDRVEVRCIDYRDLADGPFDKMASVGMFEHVGRERLPEYFGHLFRLIKPGGLFLNHGIGGHPAPDRGLTGRLARRLEPYLVGGSTFRERYIFPNGGLVAVSEANLIAEKVGWEVRDVENLREHYAITLRHWASRLEARADEARRLGGEGMFRLWRLYMGMAAWQFACGEFGVFQSLLQKPTGGESGLPLSRADIYSQS